jgi:hypothetical protein
MTGSYVDFRTIYGVGLWLSGVVKGPLLSRQEVETPLTRGHQEPIRTRTEEPRYKSLGVTQTL